MSNDTEAQFRALLASQSSPPGFKTACQIWQGEPRTFQATTPRLFMLGLRGIQCGKRPKISVLCKTPGCVEHIKLREKK